MNFFRHWTYIIIQKKKIQTKKKNQEQMERYQPAEGEEASMGALPESP